MATTEVEGDKDKSILPISEIVPGIQEDVGKISEISDPEFDFDFNILPSLGVLDFATPRASAASGDNWTGRAAMAAKRKMNFIDSKEFGERKLQTGNHATNL